ncbi:bacteriohemerythrin [Candidatus Magnetobacterium casense]|uniref:Bacteriohemerythrin n=1 Tax=Candidatus Magnetobacterium casense TaxID=1455061 RepID=A0ABS6RX37_9BACT|nr:bacteriohemerythrin [Candidatus Magnetobacterium casensis]MBV6341190.1 bacteriohemerythrin [Candidatus Magnetobacterium casensis]
MKIKTRLRGTVTLFFLLGLASAISVYVLVDRMELDGRVVNYTGIVRGATQRLVKLEISGRPSDELIARLDKIINGLINGDSELKLPRATDSAYISVMNETIKVWGELKQIILSARSDPSLRDVLLKQSEEYFELTNKAVSETEKFSRRKVDNLKNIQIMLIFMSLIIAVYVWINSRTHITMPLSMLAEKVRTLVTGDLRLTIDYSKKDEIGILSQGMNEMISSFSNAINAILSVADSLSLNVETLLKTKAEKTKKDSEILNTQATQSAAAAEEMNVTITSIASNTTVVAEASSKAMEYANKGKEVSDGAVDIIYQVSTSTDALAKMITNLNKSVAEIGDVVTVINDIADQTNLLALNAAIEAARAGEQGRGFAVVADEVRKLAERTIKQTTEISTKIKLVQEDSQKTTRSMTEASTGVTRATEYINDVGSSLSAIVGAVKDTRDQIGQIQASVDKQLELSEKVTSSVLKTSVIVSDMGNLSDEVMADLAVMSGISEELRTASARFKTRAEEWASVDMFDGATAAAKRPLRIGHETKGLGMQWDSSFSVNNALIDKQHQELFKLKNDLLDVMSQGKGKEDIARILKFLEDYAVKHFKTEEDLMKKYSYPGYDLQLKHHHALIDTVGKFKAKFMKDGPSETLLLKVQQELDKWLKYHIKQVDIELGNFLKSKGYR